MCNKFCIKVIKKNLAYQPMEIVFGNKAYKTMSKGSITIYEFHKDTILSTLALSYWMKSRRYHCFAGFLNNMNANTISFYSGSFHNVMTNKLQSIFRSFASIGTHQMHFRNYSKVMQKRISISWFWSAGDSLEIIDKILNIKTAHSIKPFDFSTLIYHSMVSMKVPDLLQWYIC